MTVLTIMDFSLKIGSRQVLSNINLTAEAGECVGIVGESGSGKSLTASATFGLLPKGASINGGHIMVCGVNPLAASKADVLKLRREKASLIFQDPMTALNPTRRLGKQMLDVLGDTGKAAKTRILSVLERLQLPDPERAFQAYPFELSGGQRQRALIAMGLMHRPQLIVSDEVTTALDVSLRGEILKLLRQQSDDNGASVIMISHDLKAVAQLCDRVYVMRAGRVVEGGRTAEILSKPKENYTQHLLNAQPERFAPFSRLPVGVDIL